MQVYKERGKQQESLIEKTAKLELKVTNLKKERDRAEEKLMEISNESLQVCKKDRENVHVN